MAGKTGVGIYVPADFYLYFFDKSISSLFQFNFIKDSPPPPTLKLQSNSGGYDDGKFQL